MFLANNTLLQGGKYKIVRHLSSGGFGNTYEGVHTMMDTRVAIKEFFPKMFCNRDENTSYITVATQGNRDLVDKLRHKFIDEAKAIFKMNHPNIVKVHDIFEENGTAYFVMDYIDGKSLGDIVKERGALPEAEAVGYIRQVAEALKYVHSLNRLHLDIKPGNVMVDISGKAVLIDFGASKHYDMESGENTSTLMGVNTKGYAPVEQSTQSFTKFSPATDIYALGATLYKLLTGITPPDAGLLLAKEEALAPMPVGVSVATQTAVSKAMAPIRSERPQEVDEFLALLEPDIMDNSDEDATLYEVKDNGCKATTETVNRENVAAEEGLENAVQLQKTAKSARKENGFSGSDALAKSSNNNSSVKKHIWTIGSLCLLVLVAVFVIVPLFLKENLSVTTPVNAYAADDFHDGLGMIHYGGKYGFVDKKGRVVVPCIYDLAWPFHEGLAVVQKNGFQGYIDKTGREVIPCKYDSAFAFSEGLAPVRVNDKMLFIDKTGRVVIPSKYDAVDNTWEIDYTRYSFSEGLACVELNGKLGFIDKTGREVIPCIYDFALPFSEGLAVVELNGKFGYIDKTGREVIPCIYGAVADFSEGLAAVKLNGQWGFIDKNGREVIPCIYGAVADFSEGLAAVEFNGKQGYIDKTGREVVPCIYDTVADFSEGLAAVELNGQWGFIDKNGTIVIPFNSAYDFKYFNASKFSCGFVMVKYNGNDIFIDQNEHRLVIYD